jgi:hypothetical protein
VLVRGLKLPQVVRLKLLRAVEPKLLQVVRLKLLRAVEPKLLQVV